MVDRPIVYVGELPRAEDFLGLAKDMLYGVGHLARAAIGPAPTAFVSGLAISPTGPASLSIVIAGGSLYLSETVDATAYGVLGTDTNTVVKQGILAAPVTLTCTAPGTSGYSQNYLVEVGYLDSDTGAIVPPYYNSAYPQMPWNGAGGLGGSQNTIRQGELVVTLKPGTAAPSGSQTTPGADPGYVGLWAIAVANMQTQITSTSWWRLALDQYSPPWFPPLNSLDGRYLKFPPTTTYYIGGTGASDTLYDGTSATINGPHGPWASVAHAIAVISTYQSSTQIVLNVAAGTYVIPGGSAAGAFSSSTIASWSVVGAGASSTIFNCTATGARGFTSNGSVVTITGVSVSAYYECYAAQSGGELTLFACNMGGSAYSHGVASYFSGLVYVYGNMTISGSYALNIFNAGPGSIEYGYHDVNVSYSPTLTFSVASVSGEVIGANNGGVNTLVYGYVTFSGTPTGKKYYANTSGGINGSGGALALIPGTIAGTVDATTYGWTLA